MGLRRRNWSLERRLRRERPKPSDDLVRRISGRIAEKQPRRHWNLGLAFALTVAVLTAFALTGGVRYAQSAITHGTQAVTHLVSAKSSAKSASDTKRAKDEERGKRGDDNGDDDEGSGDDQYKHKVLLCHKPNSRHPQTIRVRQSAVAAHLAHGDTRGACPRKHDDDNNNN